MRSIAKLFAAIAVSAAAVYAGISLDPVFTSNMMLQRGRPIVFFGKADPGSKLKASFDGVSLEGTAREDGAWSFSFAPKEAGHGTFGFTVGDGEAQVSISNIIIGDVWICAGQSNMEMPIGKTFRRGWSAMNCEQEVADADYPEIRYADQTNRLSMGALRHDAAYAFGNGWVQCSPETADKFSAAAYFFARRLHKDLGIPIGLVNITWSGTRIQPWISEEGYRAAGLKDDLETIASFDKFTPEYRKEAEAKANAEYKQKLAQWQARMDAVTEEEKAKLNREKPVLQPLPWNNRQTQCNIFNGMVPPWTRLPARGVIWYQGCSNSGQLSYYKAHKALINDWRKQWGSPDMPFIIVQLASFSGPQNWKELPPPQDPTYPLTRDIQARVAAEMKNVGLACTIDIGELDNIHPANKQDVGLRLALEAERIAYYGKAVTSKGPVFSKAAVENGAMRVFYEKGSAQGLKTSDGQAPRGFELAGADGKLVWADAVIDGDSVVVSSPQVPEPVTVRYAYVQFRDDYNLQNSSGLPAYPFRSDAIDYDGLE